MKKVIIYLSMVVLVSGSCNKQFEDSPFSDPRLTEFTESADYTDLFIGKGILSAYGKINPAKSFVTEVQIDNSLCPVLNLVIEKDNIVSGVIVAISIDSDKKLSTGHKYAIVLCDTREFDLISKTGLYKVYDANYDFFIACEIESIDNRITRFSSFDMPLETAIKYQFSYGESKTHPCDSSQDGNISFGECYSCLKEAIASDSTAEFMCDALDVGFLCSGSVAAACVLISSIR